MIDYWPLERAATLPALFLVGAPRCGTTSLAGALAQHSRIAFSLPKEPHFFTRRPADGDPATIRRRYLEAHFPHLSRAHGVFAEGSVSTLYDPVAVSGIRRCFPAAQFIVMLRNPLELLPSYHRRLLFLLDEDQRDFRKAWDLQWQRAAGWKIPRDCRDPNLLRYTCIGRLGAAVADLFAAAGAERCHVIVYDDYARDSQQVYREVLARVGLQPEIRGPIKRRNVNRVYRYRWLQRFFRRPSEKMAKAMRQTQNKNKMLIPRMLQRIKRWNTFEVRRAPLEPEFQTELVTTYRADIARLSALLGRDLTPWLEGRPVAPQAAPRPAEAARA
jgi:hypothetical protein